MQLLWNKREAKIFFLLYQFVFWEDLAGLTICNNLSPNWVILLACFWRCCWRSCWGPVQKSDQSMCWSDRKLVKALKPASLKWSTARWVMGKERGWCDVMNGFEALLWLANGTKVAHRNYTAYFCHCFHQQWTPCGLTSSNVLVKQHLIKIMQKPPTQWYYHILWEQFSSLMPNAMFKNKEKQNKE